MAVSSAAYTESVDGLYTSYEWKFDSSATSVNSYMVGSGYQPSMRIYLRFLLNNFRQNGGVNTDSMDRFKYFDVSDSSHQNQMSLYTAGPLTLNSSGSAFVEYPVVMISTRTGVDDFSTSKDFSFVVSLNTVDSYNSLTGEGDTSYHFVQNSRINLLNGSNVVYSLEPSIINCSEVLNYQYPTAVSRYLFRYDLVFSLDNSNSDVIEFDSISFSFPCVTIIPEPASENNYYTRINLSCSNPELVIAPTESMLDDYLLGTNINDDLISKLGTINTVDQARINAQSSAYSEVSAVTGSLSGMTDFSESLASQVDLSQDVDVLSEGALIDSVNNMWDLFPWDSPFMTTAIGMVGSIALLSLVLHGGERALFGKSSGGRSKSSKKGDDS